MNKRALLASLKSPDLSRLRRRGGSWARLRLEPSLAHRYFEVQNGKELR